MGKYSNWGPTELHGLLDNPIVAIHSLLEVDAMYKRNKGSSVQLIRANSVQPQRR